MPHVAGLRGVLPELSKLAEVVAKPPALAAGLAAGTLVQDPSRAVYRYHQTFAGPGRSFTRKSFGCAVRLAPWSEGLIRPHEATTAAGRDAELASLRADRAQTAPLLFGVRDAASEVDRIFRKTEGTRATLTFATPDGTTHTLWRVQDAEVIGKLRHYFTPKKLHLLEGHERYEALLAYQAELGKTQELAMYSSANYALGFVTSLDDQGLCAAARHRVVRGVTVTPADVLTAARRHFIVDKLPGAAADLGKVLGGLGGSVAHQPAFVVVFAKDPDAYKLTLSPEISPLAEGVQVDRALQKLDPVVVDHLFIGRHLAGGAVTTEIDAGRALAAVGAGASAALILRPLSVEQIAHVDELGLVLPPHSTAFFPSIAPGLLSHLIDPNVDVV